MKKIFTCIVIALLSLTSYAQTEKKLAVYKNGVATHYISLTDIDSVKVSEDPKIGVINGHDYVDLGLPSGIKWATCNVGALSPKEYGNYYAWGEVVPKNEYTSENSVTDGEFFSDISGNATYDAATANWGGTWRMPTITEIDELIENCEWVWISLGNINGHKIIGPNGHSIFLPAAGYRDDSSLYIAGSRGYYWGSTSYESDSRYRFSYGLYFSSSSHFRNYILRSAGRSVRPVSE